jgi:Domain of Unknown Function (DUF928)
MPAPKFISTLFKATPALVMGTLLLVPIDYTSGSSALAQANIDGSSETLTPSSPSDADSIISAHSFFQPPRNRRSRSNSRTTTGTRQGSCLSDTETAFTIFGPDAMMGQTVSTHPEFVWHLPESEIDFPVIFRLLAPDEAGIPTLVHTEVLTYTAGFMKYQLPPTVPALSAGKEYRWQIVIECNANYPSRSLSQELSFEVVPASSELSQALSTAVTEADKASAYGQAGLWYDAIAQVIAPVTGQVTEGTTIENQAARTGLLRDLAESESENEELSQDILSIAEMTAR